MFLDRTSFLNRQLLIRQRADGKLPAILLLAMLTTFVAYIARLQPITHDAFHEMALAREWFRTGDFPQDDVFAFTPTVSPAVHHEWATGMALYVATLSGASDTSGIAWLKWTLVALLWLAMYRVARQSGSHPILFALLAPIVFPLFWVGFATLRAGMFTLVAISLQLLMQQADLRGKRRWVFLWVPLYLVWLNMHAGFVVGIAMLGLHGFERSVYALHQAHPWKRTRNFQTWFRMLPMRRVLQHWLAMTWHLLAIVPVIILGLGLNPWGWDYFPYLVRAILMPRPNILEWQPIWYTHEPFVACAMLASSLALLLYAAFERPWQRLSGFFICLLAAWMTVKHIRHGALYGVLWIALVPGWLTPTPLGQSAIRIVKECSIGFTRLAWIVTLLATGFALWQPFYRATLPENPSESAHCYPVHAVNHLLAKKFRGDLLVPFHAGSYVSWRMHPHVRVSIDGRYEVAYQEEVLPDHLKFYRAAPGWQEVLEKYQADAILVPNDSPVRIPLLEKYAADGHGWQIDYADDSYSVFLRSGDRVLILPQSTSALFVGLGTCETSH